MELLEPASDGRKVAEDSCKHWHDVLAHAAPREHVVQLYQDRDFLNRAVCRFAGAALANGEGLILVPTVKHWNAFRPRLEAEGVDVKGAQERGRWPVSAGDESCRGLCKRLCRMDPCSSGSPEKLS